MATVDLGETTMMRSKHDKMVHAGFRLPRSLLKRVDQHMERLERSIPGMTVNRSDAIKVLLLDALERAEASSRRK